jgi:2-polyprenyl-6-methoxyphenol hydroxylase-like FAD-dependent oxidoreductase
MADTLDTTVLIIGGGPAGTLLGYLLARRGQDVTVVEREDTLARDFRGETVAAPSVLTLRRLGFGADLERLGYLCTNGVTMWMEGRRVFHVDYRRFPIGQVPIDIPQPTMIGMFLDAAKTYPTFHHHPGTRFTGLIERDGRVLGATVQSRSGGPTTIRARLVVGADGRFSKVRRTAGLPANVQPMARDFLSFKLPRPDGWGLQAELVVDHDRHLVVLPTFPDYLRVGHNLPKRGLGELRAAGFDAFKQGILDLSGRLAPIVHDHLGSWADTSFLEIFTAEVPQWTKDGLVLIGDASHTCTPILGQGVNLAIQDAVCLAPVASAALERDASAVVGAAELAGFVTDRQRHKSKVTRFQRIQENALAKNTSFGVLARRAKYRTLNASPLKYRIFDGMLNARHGIDPRDLAKRAGSAQAVAGTAD